jgi:hypothetical protein
MHNGFETSHFVEDWGEPDSMTQTGVIPVDSFVPAVFTGDMGGQMDEEPCVEALLYRVLCMQEDRSVICTKNGKPSKCSVEYWDTCSRTEYNEMTTTDTRVDVVAITLKAMENSKIDIPLNHAGRTLSSSNDLQKAYAPVEVSYSSPHTDPTLRRHISAIKATLRPGKIDNIKNRGLNGYISPLIHQARRALHHHRPIR